MTLLGVRVYNHVMCNEELSRPCYVGIPALPSISKKSCFVAIKVVSDEMSSLILQVFFALLGTHRKLRSVATLTN